jgi:hypothetical protein
VGFEFDGYIYCPEDIFNASGDFWAYSVAWEQNYLLPAGMYALQIFGDSEHEVDQY